MPASCAPVITDDAVLLQVDDPEAALDGVRLEVDWVLGDVDPEFAWDDGRWVLRLPRPAAWRLEYQLTIRRGQDVEWTADPANPDRVPNPFGEKSQIRFPDYRPPGWLGTPVAGRQRRLPALAGSLAEAVPATLWSPTGLTRRHVAPLLVVHDGTDLAERGGLLRWASALAPRRPIRVLMLDPAPGLRDAWYAADRSYTDHLAQVVLPDVLARVRTGPVVCLGASLGAVSMLALQRWHPESVAALVLQSGSFFTAELDPQEQGYEHFARVAQAVAAVAEEPRVRPVPTLMTCGAIEENLANNRAMAQLLTDQGYPVDLRVVPDAHTVIGWRDAWSPALDDLLAGLD